MKAPSESMRLFTTWAASQSERAQQSHTGLMFAQEHTITGSRIFRCCVHQLPSAPKRGFVRTRSWGRALLSVKGRLLARER